MASSNGISDEQQNKQQCPSGTNDHKGKNGNLPIRTVYVRGITWKWFDRVNSYFGKFGEIQRVAVHSEDIRTQWCLVQFKRQEDAKEALFRTGNRWCAYDVKAADSLDQPDHPLQVAPEQDSDSNISVALNDDCLQAIFERLKASSLTNVAGVCRRFNQQAKKTFALKHKHLDLDEQFYRQRDSIESAMKHFGQNIQSLSVNAGLFSKEADAIRMIAEYCGPKLKHLDLQYFEFCNDLEALHSIFAGIEQLKLEECLGFIWSQIFPELQELSLEWHDFCDEDFENFENFVSRNPSLIKLSIGNDRLTPRLFRTIGQHARNLQELRLFIRYHPRDIDNQFQRDSAYIGQLSSLKKLQLLFENASTVPVLNALVAGEVPIENMEIQINRKSDIDQAINCISQLKRLKILQLQTDLYTRRVTDEDVVELAECLQELEELHLEESHLCSDSPDYGFKSQLSTIGLRKMLMHANKLKLLELRGVESIKIDVDDYKEMLNMVQERKEKTPLLIEIHDNEDQVDVPAAVLAKNQSTFNIKLIH